MITLNDLLVFVGVCAAVVSAVCDVAKARRDSRKDKE